MASSKFVPGYKSEDVSTRFKQLSDMTLMLLGKTGAGKSSLGNAILNLNVEDGFKVTSGLSSTVMRDAEPKEATINGRKVKVVDTPGVMDTNFDRPDNEKIVLAGICSGITLCPEGVDAFLLVIRQEARFTEEDNKAICKLEQQFGEHFWSYAILVFTHGDNIDNDSNTFDQFLANLKKQNELPKLKEILSKLKSAPLLVDVGRKRDAAVCSGQMNSLRFAVETLMRNNKNKYTNELFGLAKAELTAKANSKLEQQKREDDREMERMKEKVEQLEAEKRKMERLLDDERRTAEARLEDQRKMKSELNALRELERKRQEELKAAQKRLNDTEDALQKNQAETSKKLEEMSKRKCTIL